MVPFELARPAESSAGGGGVVNAPVTLGHALRRCKVAATASPDGSAARAAIRR